MNEERNKRFNEMLNSLSQEEFDLIALKQTEKDENDFRKLSEALKIGKCSFCGYSISHFSESKPCFHWLLKPKGFKKRHFPLLYEGKGFHQIEAYLRWVANTETPLININDLVDEQDGGKVIQLTIKYKNPEWSFSCSESDFKGHQDSQKGAMPHYHFQMKIDGWVMINYSGFHIPFNDYDDWSFAVKRGDFDRLKAGHIHGASIQDMFDRISAEELLDNMVRVEDENTAAFNMQTIITDDEGTTISGDDLADLFEESKRTGVPVAKLIHRLKNVRGTTFITPGPAVPEMAKRTPHKKR